jgi:hypothetical protein
VVSPVELPLKACGNDGLVGELGVEGHTPFSFSVGERKLMNHFVVRLEFSSATSLRKPRKFSNIVVQAHEDSIIGLS